MRVQSVFVRLWCNGSARAAPTRSVGVRILRGVLAPGIQLGHQNLDNRIGNIVVVVVGTGATTGSDDHGSVNCVGSAASPAGQWAFDSLRIQGTRSQPETTGVRVPPGRPFEVSMWSSSKGTGSRGATPAMRVPRGSGCPRQPTLRPHQ